MVRYYQADGAKRFLGREVEATPSLKDLAAFESAFDDGPVHKWSDDLLSAIARECMQTRKWARPGLEECQLFEAAHAVHPFQPSRPPLVGSLCVRSVKPSAEEHLKMLRPATLLAVMQAVVSRNFSLDK